MITQSEMSKHSLLESAFMELPLGKIEPRGWLKEQLKIQAAGMTGKLEEHWDDVGPNSGWLGGTGESWERGPYYLDGLLPLAYLLKDEKLIEKSTKWIEWTLASQKENGQFGPTTNDDWWSRMVMLKVLIQYKEVTDDERVVPFMLKYFQYQKQQIEERPLTEWAQARGGENILCLQWLYKETGEEWLLELALLLKKQTIDWTNIYTHFPFWRYQTRFDHRVHVVNVAMSLKYPALNYLLTGETKDYEAPWQGISSLMNYHGQVHGMFSGDEWLAGTHPSQGVELCSVVEYMYSLENLVRIYGEGKYGDILEKVAFNALPATITSDWTGHQYDQQVNQIQCTQAKRNWTLNGDESNMFGLEPNFGCCTANMHQGWPKLASHLWMSTSDKGLAAISYVPCRVSAQVGNGEETIIEVDTEYPFKEKITIKICKGENLTFPIKLRIPEWCKNPVINVNGEKVETTNLSKGFLPVNGTWSIGDRIELYFPMDIRVERRADHAVGIQRGPLMYGLMIEEQWRKRSGNEPFPNREVVPRSPWNYGLKLDEEDVNKSFQIVEEKVAQQPFEVSNAPIRLLAKGRRIPGWGIENNSAGTLPISPVKTDQPLEDIVLVPYGSTRLRIAEFPVLEG